MTDAELIARLRAGDREAFRTLVGRYQDAVFGIAASRIATLADAEDVAQETFLAAYQSLARLKDPAKFGSWLYSIALNKVRMYLRATKTRHERTAKAYDEPSHPRLVDGCANARDTLASRERRDAVMDALQRLTEAQRETAMLFYINGYSLADIASFTAHPLGTVKRRLHDARQELRKGLIDMVEDELKGSRPGASFTERVVSRVNKIRICSAKSSPLINHFMLTDIKGRSIRVSWGSRPATNLKSWLAKAPSRNRLDIHASLAQCLAEFGWKIADVVVETDLHGVRRASVRIQSATRRLELPAETIDSLDFAARADAAIYVDEALVEQNVIKDDAGNPLPPGKAWRRYLKSVREWEVKSSPPPFDTVADVIRAIKKNPGDYDARQALTEAAEPFHWTPPRIKDRQGAWATFERWVKRSKGTRWEGLAAGLMGAVFLWPKCDARGALPYYEQAHACLPEDTAIAFELATVYAFTQQAAKALKLLRWLKDKPGAESPAMCGNFRTLWSDPRFEKLFGKPDPRFMNVLARPLLDMIGAMDDHFDTFTKATKPSRAVPVPKDTQRGRIEAWAKLGALLAVTSLTRQPYEGDGPAFLTLMFAGHESIRFRIRQDDEPVFDRAFFESKLRDPHTAETGHNLLALVGIKLEAVILSSRRRGVLEGVLAVTNECHQALVPISGASGLALAFMAKCPVLAVESVVKKCKTATV